MPTGQFELNKQTLSVIKEIGGDIPGGFFIYRREEPGEVLYANKALYTIYGCRDQDEFRELTGGTFKGMVHPDDYENVVKSAEAQVQENDDRTDHVEFRFFRKDGQIRFAGDHGRYTETGNFGGFYTAFISDITQEREQRENDTAVRDAVIVHSIEELKQRLADYDPDDVYCIGGDSIYRQLLPMCDLAYVTRIDYTYEADSHFPDLDRDPAWEMTARSEEQTYFDLTYYFTTYHRKAGV